MGRSRWHDGPVPSLTLTEARDEILAIMPGIAEAGREIATSLTTRDALLALMQDQLAFLHAHGIAAASIDSAQSREQTAQTASEHADVASILGGKEADLRIQQRYMRALQSQLGSLSLQDFLRDFLAQVWSQVQVLTLAQDGQTEPLWDLLDEHLAHYHWLGGALIGGGVGAGLYAAGNGLVGGALLEDLIGGLVVYRLAVLIHQRRGRGGLLDDLLAGGLHRALRGAHRGDRDRRRGAVLAHHGHDRLPGAERGDDLLEVVGAARERARLPRSRPTP